MNGFLVILAQTCDDLPLGLFRRHNDALVCAQSLSPNLGEKMQDIFINSDSVAVRIVEFANGRPISNDIIKEF